MNFNKLVKEIKSGNVQNIYLFFGQEQYFCKEIVKLLEERVINPSFRDLNYEYIEGENITVQRIENACETLPFMDERRLVILKNFSLLQGGKTSKEEEEQIKYLVEYIQKVPQSTCLVFWQSESIDKRKKLFQAIKKIGAAWEFEKLKSIELEKWIERHLRKKSKGIQRSALHFFMENGDYLSKNSTKTLIDIANEIDKIVDYVGDRKEIFIEDIEKILPRKLENDIFKMVDAIGQKNKKISLKLLNDMLKEGENEIKILSMIARQFRILIQCRELRDKGYSPKEIANKLHMMPFVVNKGISQSKYFDRHTLKEAIHSTLEMDLKIKTGKINEKLALEMLIYEYTRS